MKTAVLTGGGEEQVRRDGEQGELPLVVGSSVQSIRAHHWTGPSRIVSSLTHEEP